MILVLVRVMTVRRWGWGIRLVATLGLGIGLALAHAGLEVVTTQMAHSGGGGHSGAMAGAFFPYHVVHGLLTYLVLYAVAVTLESDRAAHARELREVQLREQVSRAQLNTLRMQLQPHFLFNTLNSISALVEDDVAAGQRMIGRLSEFLRATLTSPSHANLPLREELEFLQHYLELEQVRFADRLRVELDVEPGADAAEVPNLILQPLVENAIRHGIQPSMAGGTLTVRARRDGEWLVIDVLDDGVGLSAASGGKGTGIGLTNTRERLRESFGDRHQFTIAPRSPSGTRVTLRVPWKTSAALGVAA